MNLSLVIALAAGLAAVALAPDIASASAAKSCTIPLENGVVADCFVGGQGIRILYGCVEFYGDLESPECAESRLSRIIA